MIKSRNNESAFVPFEELRSRACETCEAGAGVGSTPVRRGGRSAPGPAPPAAARGQAQRGSRAGPGGNSRACRRTARPSLFPHGGCQQNPIRCDI